jgi:hypothetical protein
MACGGANVSHNTGPKRSSTRVHPSLGRSRRLVVLLVVAALVLLTACGLGVLY